MFSWARCGTKWHHLIMSHACCAYIVRSAALLLHLGTSRASKWCPVSRGEIFFSRRNEKFVSISASRPTTPVSSFAGDGVDDDGGQRSMLGTEDSREWFSSPYPGHPANPPGLEEWRKKTRELGASCFGSKGKSKQRSSSVYFKLEAQTKRHRGE